MVLSRSLYRQGRAICQKLERDRHIKELGEKVSTLEKKLEEERAARKEADKSSTKAKKELDKEPEALEKELDAFTSRYREVTERYYECLRGAGADTEFPGECTMEDFIVWL